MVNKIKFYNVKDVRLTDGFFKRYADIIAKKTLFEQWDILNDKGDAKGHAVINFEIAAGQKKGEYQGLVFQDSDLYKWLEAAGNVLSVRQDSKLAKLVDYAVKLIQKTQADDGYINTYFSLVHPDKRFVDFECSHELYCAGHFFEAAVSVFEATNDKRILDVAQKFADYLVKTFGTDESQIDAACGHQEAELALVCLAELTGEQKYRDLARYFLETRGKKPNYFIKESEIRKGATVWTKWLESAGRLNEGNLKYFQAHDLPVNQQAATGHAVRMVYQITGMAAVANSESDPMYIAAKRLFDNIIERQMYITGAIGQTNFGEAFSVDYDLPLVSAYAETCASIGLVMAAKQLMRVKPNAAYAAIVERVIYNGVLPGINLECDKYFYVNPQECNPIRKDAPYLDYIKYERQPWHGCACCPPNLSRFLTSVQEYIYMRSEDALYVNLLISSELDGKDKLKMKCKIAKNAAIKITADKLNGAMLKVRIPEYIEKLKAMVNDTPTGVDISDGYASFDLKDGDDLVIKGFVKPIFVRADEKLNYCAGRVAVTFGPYVMCAEECDNGANLHNLVIKKTAKPIVVDNKNNIPAINVAGYRQSYRKSTLYFKEDNPTKEDTKITFVPYYYWNNRGAGEMSVWIRKD